jgi:hypothetical protein
LSEIPQFNIKGGWLGNLPDFHGGLDVKEPVPSNVGRGFTKPERSQIIMKKGVIAPSFVVYIYFF